MVWLCWGKVLCWVLCCVERDWSVEHTNGGGYNQPTTKYSWKQPHNQVAEQPTNQSNNQAASQPFNQQINQPTSQSTNQPTNKPTSQPRNQPISQT